MNLTKKTKVLCITLLAILLAASALVSFFFASPQNESAYTVAGNEVTCGSGIDKSAISVKAVTGSYVAEADGKEYDNLQEAVNASVAGGTVQLLAKAIISSPLTITKAIKLDLNGNTVDRNLESKPAESNGSVIAVGSGGKLTLTSSAIDGKGNTKNGIICNGNTTGNGGGILVESGGSLTIDNGVSIIFNLAGGKGGGVYFEGETLSINGALTIKYNKDNSALAANSNLYLPQGKKITVAGKLMSSCGITTAVDYNDAEFTIGYTTVGNTESPEKYFFMDDANKGVRLSANNEVKESIRYKITFNGNGGSVVPGVTSYVEGVGATLANAKGSKTGHDFAGWYGNAECTGERIEEVLSTDTGDKTFYAKYTPKVYTITYNYITPSIEDENSAYTFGTGTTLKTPTAQPHLIFLGWYGNANCTGERITQISATDIGNKTFYAKWEAREYTISYAGMDGADSDEVLPTSHTYGMNTMIPDAKKSGYIFDGWKVNGSAELTKNLTLGATTEFPPDGIALTAVFTLSAATVGDEPYADITSALAKWLISGDRLKLYKDAVLAANQMITQTCTLDLNGKTLTAGSYHFDLKSGELTVLGGGEITATANLFRMIGGSLAVEGGDLSTLGVEKNIVYNGGYGGTVRVSGGTLKSTVGTAIYVNSATVSISGGTISGSTYAVELRGDKDVLYLSGSPSLYGGTADIGLLSDGAYTAPIVAHEKDNSGSQYAGGNMTIHVYHGAISGMDIVAGVTDANKDKFSLHDSDCTLFYGGFGDNRTLIARIYYHNYTVKFTGDANMYNVYDIDPNNGLNSIMIARNLHFADILSTITEDAEAGKTAQGIAQMPQINIKFGDGINAIEQDGTFEIPEGDTFNYLVEGKTNYTGQFVAVTFRGTGTLTLNADISSSGWAISNKESGIVEIIGGTITSSGNTTVFNEGSGTIILRGGTVQYTGSNSNNYGISSGNSSYNSEIKLYSGTVVSDNTYAVSVFRNVTLFGDVTLTSAANKAQFYIGTDKSLTVDSSYTTINNQYTLHFETVASGSVAVNATKDTAHFAVTNYGYEFAADTTNNQLNLIMSRTYYYNYTIAKDGADFVITDTSPDGTNAIEIYRGTDTALGSKIDNDRKNADGTYNDCTITFRHNGTKSYFLDLDKVIFYCSYGNYLVKGSVTSAEVSTIKAVNSANVTIDANINNTNEGNGSAIGMSDSASVTVIGGTISAKKRAICHGGIGLLTVSQAKGKTTLITSETEGTATDGTEPGTIYIMYNSSKPEYQLFSMTDGKVENTNTTSGVAIIKQCHGAISISGGNISAKSTALYVSAWGETTISGGTFTSNSTDETIKANDDNLTISGGTITQNGTGSAVWFFGRQDASKQLSITGCPSINGIIFVRGGINGTGYTGGLVKIDFTKWMIKDGAFVVYGSTDLSKWELTTPGYALISDSTNRNLIAKASVKVTFDMSGVLDNSEESVNVGSKITTPASPTAIGFEFVGWYADADFVQEFDFDTAITSVTKIYAKWTLADFALSVTGDDTTTNVNGNITATYDGLEHHLSPSLSVISAKIVYTCVWKESNGPDNGSVKFVYKNAYTKNLTLTVTATYSYGSHTATISKDISFTLTVNKATMTITANDQTIRYGDTISQTSYILSGFLGADDISNSHITGVPTLTANATTVADGDTINIDVSGMSASNYTFIGVSGTLKIEKGDYTSAPAHTEITGTYDKNNTLADFDFALAEHFWWKTPTEKPTVAVTSYSAYYNTDPANYNDFIVSVTLTLSKQKITVPTIDSKIYNGQTQTADIAANGFYTVTANAGGKDARADYVVTLTLEDFDNTEWDSATGLSGTHNETLTLSFAITRRAITVTIADQRSAEGRPLIDLATALNAWHVTVGNLLASDDLGITLSTAADKNTVAVTAITGTATNTNYQVTFFNGNYSVYSVAGFTDFMTDYGATIVLTPGEIKYAQVADINAMYLAYEGLDEDSLSQFAETDKDSIAALKIKADDIIKAKTEAETALNALNVFTTENIRADGISTWKDRIATAGKAVADYTPLSTGLSSADLDGYTNIAAATTLTDNYDSALTAANTALADLKDKTAQGIVDATYTRADLQTLVDTAKAKEEAFYASGGTAENLSDLAEIARVEEELRAYGEYSTFVVAHGTAIQMAVQQLAYADLTAIDAMVSAFGGLNEKAKSLLTVEQRTNISALETKSSEIQSAKSAAETALAALKDITATGIRNNAPTCRDAESLIAAATDKIAAYKSLSSGGLTEGDLADYGSIAAAEKAVADYKTYKLFADSHGGVYAKDPTKLTYPKVLEVSETYAAYLLLTKDVKNVLTEEESANIAALKEKADALNEKKELADAALEALKDALTDGADKETLQYLLADAFNKTESFFSENGTAQDLAEYDALQNSKDKISEYEKQEFENQVNEDLGAIEDLTPDVVGGMDIPNLEDTIDKVQDAIDTIDASSDKTKEELKDKREELSEIKDNLTQKLNLEKTKVAAINELKAEREQLLMSSAYSSSAKKEIAEYYTNAIETIALATDLSAIAEHKDACIEEMNSVEILHVGLLVANISFAVLLIGEILLLIFRKNIMHKKKETKAYSSALPLVLLAAASGNGLTVGVTFLVILILAVVVLGIYIVHKVLRELNGKTALTPIVDKVDELVKKGADGAKKMLGKKAVTADLIADTATVAVESPVSEADTATVVISGAQAEAPQDIHPSLPSEYSTNGSNSDETAAAMGNEEETEVFKGIEAHTGLAILARYRKSFLAKLIQSPDETKRYYSELKNALLSFNKVTSRISWSYDSINLGRTKLAKFNVRGKTLCLYLALEPDDFAETKYKVERTESKKYEATPCLYKIKNVRRATYALDLIAKLGSAFGLTSGETQTEDYAAENPYDTTESLIAREFIKELITKENYEAYLKRQQEQEHDGKKREFVSASEVSSLLSDEVAATLIEERNIQSAEKSGKAEKRVRGIVNIDKISEAFGAGDTVTLSALQGKGLLSKSVNYVKILARGSLNKPLTVESNEFSLEAVKMVLLTGGKVIKIKD